MHATYLYNPRLGESDRVNEKFEGLIKNIIGTTPTDDMLLALAAAAKIYVGEIVESALEVSKENKDLGPLTPMHVQEARRRLKKTFKRIL